MKHTLNAVTGTKSITSDLTPLNTYEILLHTNFTEELTTLDYPRARCNIINHIVKEKNISQDTINKIAELRNAHFLADPDDVPEINDILTGYKQEEAVSNQLQDLLTYLRPIVEEMPDSSFNSLVDIAVEFPDLVYFVLQPAFILSLGINAFMSSIRILMHEGNFPKLLMYCKNYKNSISLSGFYNEVISLAKPYLLKGSMAAGIFITVPFLIYSLVGYYSAGPTETKSNAQLTSTHPLILTSFREGSGISQAVDKVAGLLRQVGSEMAVLTGSLFHGYMNEIFFTAIETTKIDLESLPGESEQLTPEEESSDSS
jgi:hypothetical protein